MNSVQTDSHTVSQSRSHSLLSNWIHSFLSDRAKSLETANALSAFRWDSPEMGCCISQLAVSQKNRRFSFLSRRNCQRHSPFAVVFPSALCVRSWTQRIFWDCRVSRGNRGSPDWNLCKVYYLCQEQSVYIAKNISADLKVIAGSWNRFVISIMISRKAVWFSCLGNLTRNWTLLKLILLSPCCNLSSTWWIITTRRFWKDFESVVGCLFT
jgi:hypothetical protein